MSNFAELTLEGKTYQLPIVVGTENEKAIDINDLRAQTGYITLDSGYKNTGATQSAITFLDGEKGILSYRGYPIEQLAEKSDCGSGLPAYFCRIANPAAIRRVLGPDLQAHAGARRHAKDIRRLPFHVASNGRAVGAC